MTECAVALYEAQANGRNRVEACEQELPTLITTSSRPSLVPIAGGQKGAAWPVETRPASVS